MWWEQAKCLGFFLPNVEDDIWYSTTKGTENYLIKSYCKKCPVINECLEDALKFESRNPSVLTLGIRGGLTVAQRLKIHEKNRPRVSEQSQDDIDPIAV
ncbi:MAG: WhiB family transcriptional regulator [Thermodesulfobacteriota bacterium]